MIPSKKVKRNPVREGGRLPFRRGDSNHSNPHRRSRCIVNCQLSRVGSCTISDRSDRFPCRTLAGDTQVAPTALTANRQLRRGQAPSPYGGAVRNNNFIRPEGTPSLSIVNCQLSIEKGAVAKRQKCTKNRRTAPPPTIGEGRSSIMHSAYFATDPFQVLLINFSLHLGQRMLIFPLPLGTRTLWRHLGQR